MQLLKSTSSLLLFAFSWSYDSSHAKARTCSEVGYLEYNRRLIKYTITSFLTICRPVCVSGMSGAELTNALSRIVAKADLLLAIYGNYCDCLMFLFIE
jgi:hypothetical protein